MGPNGAQDIWAQMYLEQGDIVSLSLDGQLAFSAKGGKFSAITLLRCRPTTKMVTVPETRMETRCRMVSRPVTRTETTYSMQYDSFTKSSRSVPQTRAVTRYEMQNECRPESVTQTVTKSQFSNECGMESVTRTVTRYEFQYQHRFVPPHFESVTTKKLRETEPKCRLSARSCVTGRALLREGAGGTVIAAPWRIPPQ